MGAHCAERPRASLRVTELLPDRLQPERMAIARVVNFATTVTIEFLRSSL